MNDPDSSKPRYTTRTDKLGNKVKVSAGHRFFTGRNGKGISVGPGETTKQDRHGQIYAIPVGGRVENNSDGTITPLSYRQKKKEAQQQTAESEAKKAPKFGAAAKIKSKKTLASIYENMIRKDSETN